MKHTYSLILLCGLSTSSLFSMSYLQCINWKQFLAPCAVVAAWELGKKGYAYFYAKPVITKPIFKQKPFTLTKSELRWQLAQVKKTCRDFSKRLDNLHEALGIQNNEVQSMSDEREVIVTHMYQNTQDILKNFENMFMFHQELSNQQSTFEQYVEGVAIHFEQERERTKENIDAVKKALQTYQSDVFKALEKQSRIATNRTDSAWVSNRFKQVEDRVATLEKSSVSSSELVSFQDWKKKNPSMLSGLLSLS